MDTALAKMYEQWEHENLGNSEARGAICGYRRAKSLKLLSEIADRRRETLGLYEPLAHVAPFHESNAPERILRGSNRSGKTLSSAVEMARIVTNQDPFKKYPQEGRAIVVGKDGRHLSNPLYRLLFKPGAIKVIITP